MNRLFRRSRPDFRDYAALALFAAAYLMTLALVAAPEHVIPLLTPEEGAEINDAADTGANHA